MSKSLKNIFLSASIPLETRDSKYFETADILAIRDSVISLATAVLPEHKLIWGGHPSITPLVNYVLQVSGINIQDHMTIYQSKFFEKSFLPDNNQFDNIITTENLGEKDASLKLMREKMLGSNDFSAGIFIGGMEGVEEEFMMFREFHSNAIVIPVASTGAAAKMIFDKYYSEKGNKRFLLDYAYSSVFQKYLLDKI